jgi:uncharacterized protein (TIGR02145 family)
VSTYATLVDSRDNQTYRTVRIGTQTWMAENLAYAASGSRCYNDDTSNCRKYGRLYPWTLAMSLDSSYTSTLWNGSLPRQGVCPTAWHVPSAEEWHTLQLFADSAHSEYRLAARGSAWNSNAGIDVFGFRALPAGYYGNNAKQYFQTGQLTDFQTSSDNDILDNVFLAFVSGYQNIYSALNIKTNALSVRCIAD